MEEYENIEEFIESSVKMNRQLVFEFVRIWKRKNWKMEYKSSRKAIRANLDEMPKFAPSCENIIQAEYSVPDFGFELLDSNFIMDAVALTVKDVDDSIENILTKNKFQYLYIYAINHFVVAGLPVADVRSRLAESEKIPMELQLLPTNETFVSDKQALTLWITSENPISKYNLVDVEVVASTPRIIPKACMQKNCCKFRHFIPPELYGKFVYQINHVNVIELDFHQIPDVIALKNTNVLFTLIDVAVPFNKESTINKRIIVDMELSKWIKYDTNVNKSQNSDKPTEFINNAKETQNSQVKSTNIHFELGPSPNEKVINQKERAQYSSKRELVRAKRGQVKIIKSNRGEQCSIRTMDCNSFQIRQIRLDAHTAFPGIVLQNTNSIGLTIAQFTRYRVLHLVKSMTINHVQEKHTQAFL